MKLSTPLLPLVAVLLLELSGCKAYIKAEKAGESRPGAAGAPGAGAEPGTGSTTDADIGSGGTSGSTGALALDCSQAKLPGAPLRRLTREQYTNSVRDILGVTVQPEAIPADERAGAFSANLSAPVDALAIDSYQSVAENSAAQAAKNWSKLAPCASAADSACASSTIARLGRLLYRRPLSSDETSAYAALYATYSKPQGFGNGLRVVVETMLQSPRFLYLVEPAAAPGTRRALTAFELATRLSLFIWSSSPDDDLLDAAAGGKLDAVADMRTRVASMIADPRAASTIHSFHRQWLGLDSVATVAKDPAVYPNFGAQRDAMLQETLAFADYVLRKADGKLSTLLTAPYSLPTAPLLSIYGLPPGTVADGMTPVALDPTERAGLLTQPAFLAVNAHASTTAPIKRGNIVRKNLLCLTTPDPPAGVKTTLPVEPVPTTMREQVEQHEANPACAACHFGMDGIGLGFEAYDAVGAFRTTDAGKPVDSSGTITGTRTLNGDFNGAVELAQRLSNSAEAQACVAQQWYRYAVGRVDDPADPCALQPLALAFTASGGDMRALIADIATSEGFRNLVAEAGTAP